MHANVASAYGSPYGSTQGTDRMASDGVSFPPCLIGPVHLLPRAGELAYRAHAA